MKSLTIGNWSLVIVHSLWLDCWNVKTHELVNLDCVSILGI